MDYIEMGRRIYEIRKKNKLTQSELAERVGISLSFIGHIERGNRVASLETVVKIANALGVSVARIIPHNHSIDYDKLKSALDNIVSMLLVLQDDIAQQ